MSLAPNDNKKIDYVYPPIFLLSVCLAIIIIFSNTNPEAHQANDHLLDIDTPDEGYLMYPVEFIDRDTDDILTFNPFKGKVATISYKLTRAGRIRIRIVDRKDKTLILKTIIDWSNQEFGRHKLTWDGRDASGNIIDNKRCLVVFEEDSKLHATHEKAKCKELKIAIESLSSKDYPTKGIVNLTTTLFGSNTEYNKDGYRIRYFIDYQLIYKSNIIGNDKKFDLTLDTANIPNGKHLLTINVDDQRDHVGTASRIITIKN